MNHLLTTPSYQEALKRSIAGASHSSKSAPVYAAEPVAAVRSSGTGCPDCVGPGPRKSADHQIKLPQSYTSDDVLCKISSDQLALFPSSRPASGGLQRKLVCQARAGKMNAQILPLVDSEGSSA
jgi:hypothetical protein